MFIGAGLALYQATRRPDYLSDATRTAGFVLADGDLAPGGILKSENGGDGGLFKGVLVRYLALLALEPNVSATARASHISFLKFNAETAWQRGARRPPGLFNPGWTSPPQGAVESSTQTSGVMLMEILADFQDRKLL